MRRWVVARGLSGTWGGEAQAIVSGVAVPRGAGRWEGGQATPCGDQSCQWCLRPGTVRSPGLQRAAAQSALLPLAAPGRGSGLCASSHLPPSPPVWVTGTWETGALPWLLYEPTCAPLEQGDAGRP